MVNEFNLTRDNAKEYFFLNQCCIRNIDRGDSINSDKFRSYGIDKTTLDRWTNEWLITKLDNTDFESDEFEFRSIIDDLSYRIDSSNAEKMISIYKDINQSLSGIQRINLLFKHEYSEVLKMHFYYGLIYIAIKNKMTEALDPLLSELNDLLKEQPKEIVKEYDKSLKRLFKEYKIHK